MERPATKIDSKYSAVERLTDGTQVRLRLLRPSDRDGLLAGFQRLSPESRYRRFLSPTPRLSKEMLRRLIDTDDWNHLAIVAERASNDSAPAEGLGIARFIRLGDAPDTAEAAVVVDDAMHRRGLGRLLLLTLVEAAANATSRNFAPTCSPTTSPPRGFCASSTSTPRRASKTIFASSSSPCPRKPPTPRISSTASSASPGRE